MKKRTKWLILFAAVLAAALLILFNTVWKGEPEMEINGTGEVAVGELEASISASGVLAARETRDVYVETPVKVTEVLVDVDEPVKKGQPVLAVDLADLETQLAQAVLNRDSQELTLRRVRDIDAVANLESLRLAVQQAQGVLAADQATLARAQADLTAAAPLYEAGAMSDTEYQRHQRTVEDAGRRVSLSQISLSQAQANLANSRQTTEKTDAQRALDIETQENLLRLQELNVQTLQDRLDRLKAAMLAPMDGVVTQMAAQAGSSLGVAVSAYQVSDLGALEVNAQVKEVESRKVSVGQQVEITGDGIDETLVVTGRVSRIAATASTARTTVGEETVLEIVVAVDNPSAALRPGLSVTARIITDTRSSVPIIRYAMLTETPEGNPAVFRLENGRAVLTPIETGITADLDIEVTDGLAGGEVLVLNPPQEMRDGDKVVLREEAGGFFGGFGR